MTTEEQARSLQDFETAVSFVTVHRNLEERNRDLEQQLSWFKKQLFGERSEKRPVESDPNQLSLGELIQPDEEDPRPEETVQAYQRRTGKNHSEDDVNDIGLRFDATVPVETREIPNPELEGLIEGIDYEVISEKVTHRLAQRTGSYVVLKIVRKTAKLKSKGSLVCAPAPHAVFERSFADASFIAGLLIDKFLYHLPLYRQHQRLAASGINISRQTLTNLVHKAGALLEPIALSQLASILQSLVLAMDETPIKAGRSGKGKMHRGQFWVVYGDQDEVAFEYLDTRAHKNAREILGKFCGTLISDGYGAYERYAKKESSVVHAQCWAHTRRNFVEAEKVEPKLVAQALGYIRSLYQIEEKCRTLDRERVQKYRADHSHTIVQEFFRFLEMALSKTVLLDSNPFSKAAVYALKRRQALSVFLANPDVPIDTNHIERALRPIPLGRKNWLFCWTEVGAEVVGTIQGLLQTCKLHNVDPYTYLVDVLQRVDSHPATNVHLLTPRFWKQNFADNPKRSMIDPAPTP